jgi:hypothetical protein
MNYSVATGQLFLSYLLLVQINGAAALFLCTIVHLMDSSWTHNGKSLDLGGMG